MATLEDLKQSYFLREIDSDFAFGHRSNLRYATVSASVHLEKINPTGPEPFDYLQFAKTDISSGDQRGAINALSNVKRSVHLTIDTFFRLLCLNKAYSKANFPSKLTVLKKIEAFPTELINRLNQKRNLVEHNYRTVDVAEVVDFVEVAEMFLLLTYPYFRDTVVGTYVGIDKDNRCLEWVIKHDLFEIQINEVKCESFIESLSGPIYYNIKIESPRFNNYSIKITESNTDEWLSYMDLFLYCTKKRLISLPKSEDDYQGIVLKKHESHVPE